MKKAQRQKVVVAGGGAAGFFGAITCAEKNPDLEVHLLEKSPELLAKVAISGGGRCNVTHACFDPTLLVRHYPRGGRELLGPFQRWQPRDTVAWFGERGVELKTEPDGRMFPVTDRSTTITTCLTESAARAGVVTRTHVGLASARPEPGGFALGLTDGRQEHCARLLIATGGNQSSHGFALAAELGHRIEPPVPSLFSFHLDDRRIAGLAGIAVPVARVAACGTSLHQTGPLLITHWGLSGPAILKLSAWGARLFHDGNYACELAVNWCPELDRQALVSRLRGAREAHPARQVGTVCPEGLGLPARLWRSLTALEALLPERRWAEVSNRQVEEMARELQDGRFHTTGKSLFKEEFVTCGGVNLREMDFKTMGSRLVPGLYFAGEVLDMDGVTGGFNLQAAWTTGYVAGVAMAEEQGEASR